MLDDAVGLDVDLIAAVDHDVGNVVARDQRLERSQAEHVVADIADQLLLLGGRQHLILHRDDLTDDIGDLLSYLDRAQLAEFGEINGLIVWGIGDFSKGREGHGLYLRTCPNKDFTLRNYRAFKIGGQAFQREWRTSETEIPKFGFAFLSAASVVQSSSGSTV